MGNFAENLNLGNRFRSPLTPTTDFIIKLKNKIFHIFFKIIQDPFNGIFQINFCVPVPLNNTKNHFHKKKKKNRKTDFYSFVIKWYKIPLMHFASLTLQGAHP